MPQKSPTSNKRVLRESPTDTARIRLRRQAGESASAPAPVAAPKARGKASWASHGRAKETSSASEVAPRAGPRLIVFVIGGMCHSEVRATYELSKKYQRDVVIGSSELFAPAAYVQLLKSLSE